jgi:predicted nucleic acid-binding protein
LISAVDTSVLLDVFGADPTHGEASAATLRRCLAEGALVACEVVWTETAAVFPREGAFLDAMQTLGIDFSPITEKAALHAAAAWRRYRAQGGKRTRVAADFLIGAHALAQCDRLLTRDRGFFRGYFHRLRVLDPAAQP